MWAAGSLLLAGLVTLVCRMFFPGAAASLHWLWLAPILTIPAAIGACFLRAYRPDELIAVADWLNGGRGLLLTLFETDDPAWTESPLFERASTFALPRLRPWRKLAALVPALAFLATAWLLPQRTLAYGTTTALADDIAGNLTATLAELKQQQLIAPEDEKALREEIDRIRRAAEERVDASSWEAADGLREKVAAALSEKQDAVKWARESLDRYAAAQAGGNPGSGEAAELTKALEKLAKSGLLAGAPPELQRLLKGGKLPADAKSLRELTASLSKYLGETSGRFGDLAKLGKEFGRFDPSEFPLESGESPDGEGTPGRGGVNRGRGDAELTWGKETQPFDRFKAKALPPGAARSADDWTPVVELPGAPRESPELGGRSAARQYAATAGQGAWRRTLAPRHQSAVKK